MSSHQGRLRWSLFIVLVSAALMITGSNFSHHLPPHQWSAAFFSPDVTQIQQIVMHFSLAPRVMVALLVGAGLGLAGTLFQQVLRNPLAEPATLGVAAGAQLGMVVATLFFLPGEWMALCGAVVAALLVFSLSWKTRLSPVTLILAGLVIGLFSSALNAVLVLFNHQQLQSLFLWSSGSLNQQDWQVVWFLVPRVLLVFAISLLLLRPMTLLGLDDGVARNLGVSLSVTRLVILGVAVILSAQLVSVVGIIGFIGLFSPILARLCGARHLLARIIWSMLFGAALLWLTDQSVQFMRSEGQEIPTGAATALLGAPLLLWLLPRLQIGTSLPVLYPSRVKTVEAERLRYWYAGGVLLLIFMATVAFCFGQGATGWHWSWGEDLMSLLPWRWPRIVAALAAGMMLAMAGTLVQKLTGNPMASPEVLGISSGAACGVVVMLFFVPGNTLAWLLPAGTLGAMITLMIILFVSSRGGFSSQRLLLAGVALSTAFTTLVSLLLASGDLRMAGLLTWLAGSTYHVTPAYAVTALGIAIGLSALFPLCLRWLTILPLGAATAQAVGVPVGPSRFTILILASALTAASTLIVGPLSFVGLMAPHIARMMGFQKAKTQLIMSAIIGATLMLFADWLGRMLLFPMQIPAGLLATFIGAPYFIYLLYKQQ